MAPFNAHTRMNNRTAFRSADKRNSNKVSSLFRRGPGQFMKFERMFPELDRASERDRQTKDCVKRQATKVTRQVELWREPLEGKSVCRGHACSSCNRATYCLGGTSVLQQKPTGDFTRYRKLTFQLEAPRDLSISRGKDRYRRRLACSPDETGVPVRTLKASHFL